MTYISEVTDENKLKIHDQDGKTFICN